MDSLGSHKSGGRDCDSRWRACNPAFRSGGAVAKKGLADKILISQPPEQRAVSTDAMPSHAELNRQILLKLGVPAGAIETFGTANGNTREEAIALREWAGRNTASVFIIQARPFRLGECGGFFVASFSVRTSPSRSPQSNPRTILIETGGKRSTDWSHFRTKS
jgi:hypothetical protein